MPTPSHHTALFICAALAWKGNPLAGTDLQPHHAHRIVDTCLAQHTPQEILDWRTHTSPENWDQRWEWALDTTHRFFPDAPGLADLSRDHQDIPTTPTRTP
jgi:hypothetical protein